MMSEIDATKYVELRETINNLRYLLIKELQSEKRLGRIREIRNLKAIKIAIELKA
jgi:hypothetical protein